MRNITRALFATALLSTTAPTLLAQPTFSIELDSPDLRVAVEGLPAISADGTTVVLPLIGGGGYRTPFNLSLGFLDAFTGEQRSVRPIISRAEENALYDGEARPEDLLSVVQGRVETLQTELSALSLTPLIEVEVHEPDEVDGATPPVDALRLFYDEISFSLRAEVPGEEAAQPSVTLDAPQEPVDPDCADDPNSVDCDECSGLVYPPTIDTAWTSTAQDLLLLRIGYLGSHMCPEPGARFQLIRLSST